MSAYTNNAIYTAIRNAVIAVNPNAKITMTYTDKPSQFPTVFAREIGHYTPQTSATFSNAQDIYETTWEVQVFSNRKNDAKEQAYALLAAVKSALKGLYFVETSENPIDRDKWTYFLLVARFRRIIGGGESMPT